MIESIRTSSSTHGNRIKHPLMNEVTSTFAMAWDAGEGCVWGDVGADANANANANVITIAIAIAIAIVNADAGGFVGRQVMCDATNPPRWCIFCDET